MKTDYSLYVATDPELVGDRDLCDVVAAAIDGGATVVQLRDKCAGGRKLYEQAVRLLDLTRARRVPLIINDRVDVMLASGADGVHVGADDLPLALVRRIAGSSIVGYSVNTMHDLEIAHRDGADYVGMGPVFPTATKPDARDVLGLDRLAALTRRTDLPSVAIGGISQSNCAQTMRAGVTGVCVISAILGQDNVRAAAAGLAATVAETRTAE